MDKSILQEFTQKKHLSLPVYRTSNDGTDHLPNFKCSVTVNSAQYHSTRGFKHKKDAENDAARVAIAELRNHHGQDPQFGETGQLKNSLKDLALKNNFPNPTYQYKEEGEAHCMTFTATVEFNGASYTGAPGKSKKEAAQNSAIEAIRSFREQDSNSFPQPELQDENKRNNDFKQPTEECNKVIKPLSNMPADNFSPNNQLSVGTDFHSAENSAEKLNIENAPALEKVPGKIDVENPCAVGEDLEKSTVKDSGEVENGKPNINGANASSAPVEQPKQDPIQMEQHRLKEEKRGLYQDKDHGSTELEGKQQSNQEVVSTESIGKRSRSEDENAEQSITKMKKLG